MKKHCRITLRDRRSVSLHVPHAECGAGETAVLQASKLAVGRFYRACDQSICRNKRAGGAILAPDTWIVVRRPEADTEAGRIRTLLDRTWFGQVCLHRGRMLAKPTGILGQKWRESTGTIGRAMLQNPATRPATRAGALSLGESLLRQKVKSKLSGVVAECKRQSNRRSTSSTLAVNQLECDQSR